MVKSQENKWEREELLWGRHRAEQVLKVGPKEWKHVIVLSLTNFRTLHKSFIFSKPQLHHYKMEKIVTVLCEIKVLFFSCRISESKV